MKMYKLILNKLSSTYAISKVGTQISFLPTDPANTDYQKFIQDVAEQGIEIVEGPDIIEPSYQELRAAEYPSLQDQQDMQYWDQVNGTTVWKDTIEAIKTKYPKTITGGITVGEVPAWVQEAADNWTFNKQLREYVAAVERLEYYILSVGRPEIREDVVMRTEQVWNEETQQFETVNITENVVTQTAIEPLEEFVEVTEFDPETMKSVTKTVKNPLIVKDEEERSAAQAIVDATPQKIIDACSS